MVFTTAEEALRALPPAIRLELEGGGAESSLGTTEFPLHTTAMSAVMDALRELRRDEPTLFGERMEELAYLANVVLAGHERGGTRLRPKAAAEAVLATVCYGAISEVRALRAQEKRKNPVSPSELADVLRERAADLLFRAASSALTAGAAPKLKTAKEDGLLYSAEELEAAIR
jgi:hypothetical protein